MESVILQIDKKTYNTILSFNKKNGIDLSQYILAPIKKKKNSVRSINNEKIIKFKTAKEAKQYDEEHKNEEFSTAFSNLDEGLKYLNMI